jgi:hypothetical protein
MREREVAFAPIGGNGADGIGGVFGGELARSVYVRALPRRERRAGQPDTGGIHPQRPAVDVVAYGAWVGRSLPGEQNRIPLHTGDESVGDQQWACIARNNGDGLTPGSFAPEHVNAADAVAVGFPLFEPLGVHVEVRRRQVLIEPYGDDRAFGRGEPNVAGIVRSFAPDVVAPDAALPAALEVPQELDADAIGGFAGQPARRRRELESACLHVEHFGNGLPTQHQRVVVAASAPGSGVVVGHAQDVRHPLRIVQQRLLQQRKDLAAQRIWRGGVFSGVDEQLKRVQGAWGDIGGNPRGPALPRGALHGCQGLVDIPAAIAPEQHVLARERAVEGQRP